ncbi:MAG: DUF2780 domain-containing protein [Ignavibacteria bacterium]|nr:DUF2780 domain-containing protein [Ignavibacteria bacterium]
MNELIQSLAKGAGIDASMAQKGLGALLSSVKEQVPADIFSEISTAIPDSGSILSKFKGGAKAAVRTGDLMKMAGGLMSGEAKGATALLSNFSQAGFSMESAKAFMPVAITLLKNYLSPDLMKKIDDSVPGLSSLIGGGSGGSGPVNPLDSLNRLL